MATAIAIAILAAGAMDFRDVVGDVPDPPALCEPSTPACEGARNRAFADRLDRAIALEEDYRARAWLYGLGALAVVLVGAALAFVRTGRGRRRELFTDLGIGAVVWLLVGLALLAIASGGLVEPTGGPIFYPPLALLVIAGVGTLLTRGAERSGGARPADPAGGTLVLVIGFGLTAVAALLAVIALAGRGDPCVDDVPGWVGTVVAGSLLSAAAAALLGIVSLFQRRWIAALVMLAAGPFLALVATFSTVCWN